MLDMSPLPASTTKHLDVIHHPLPRDRLLLLPLRQLSASTEGEGTGTTGTTLWLGGQVLAAYLSSHPLPAGRKRAIELGAGVGYVSLVAASLGYDVLCTDIPPVLDALLRPNIEVGQRALGGSARSTPVFSGTNARSKKPSSDSKPAMGSITVRKLDWTLDAEGDGDWEEMCDMILTSDTIYHPSLLPSLFHTIARISETSHAAGKRTSVYLALERRDSRMVDAALDMAGTYGIRFKRVSQGRVGKSLRETGWGWRDEDWEGVEVYKGRWAPLGQETGVD